MEGCSFEIYSGMFVFSELPKVNITVHATHEEWDKIGETVFE